MTEKIITYVSVDADDRRAGIAFIDVGGRDYLTTYFMGRTQSEARDHAQAFWDKDREKREATIKNRAKGTKKAAAKRAAKASGESR